MFTVNFLINVHQRQLLKIECLDDINVCVKCNGIILIFDRSTINFMDRKIKYATEMLV